MIYGSNVWIFLIKNCFYNAATKESTIDEIYRYFMTWDEIKINTSQNSWPLINNWGRKTWWNWNELHTLHQEKYYFYVTYIAKTSFLSWSSTRQCTRVLETVYCDRLYRIQGSWCGLTWCTGDSEALDLVWVGGRQFQHDTLWT